MITSKSKATKLLLVLVQAGLFCVSSSSVEAALPSKIEYNRDIRPILSQNCFACHGADSASRKASLRLDRFEDATASHKDAAAAIVPGKPDESEVVRRIFTTDEEDLMPPPDSHKTLTAEQKDLLKRWIADGAKYQAHWSLLPPERVEPPKVKKKKWAKNPIDNFILARLEQEKLKPAPEADRRTLARRVSLDLTGLPPTPEEVETFVKDKSPDAYEKFVDKTLASPQWGEHRGRYWLDAARYGDTHGIHIDNYREIWSYRDWVINAFNRNQPFDQFTIEQLAGDLLPKPTLEQEIATGFNRCNITTSEGGAIDEEYYVIYARDRTETTSAVWLGLTTGCAVCHDHKFDPISQKEFYSLSAFFNNTTQKAMDGNVQNTPPVIVVAKPEDRPRWDALAGEKTDAKKKVDDRRESAKLDFNVWLTNTPPEKFSDAFTNDKPVFHALLSEDATNINVTVEDRKRRIKLSTNTVWQEGAIAAKALTINGDLSASVKEAGDFARDESFTLSAWLWLSEEAKKVNGALFARMDDTKGFRGWDFWIQNGKVGTHIINKWPENALKVISKKEVPVKRWTHVSITYDGSSKAVGTKVYIDGELQELDIEKDELKNSIRTKVPFKIGQRHKESRLTGAGVQDIRIYERALNGDEIKKVGIYSRMGWLLAKADKRTESEGNELFSHWLPNFDKPFQEFTANLKKLETEENEIKARGTIAHVMKEKETPAEAHLLFRGEYDKRRDKVTPDTPAMLPPMPADFPRNRLGFAKWLLLPENPLTARVTVNRFWQEVFGTGLVRTTGDFGVSGELPSHPELLDWLAIEFRESGWDVKQFFKLMVMSATYQQASIITPEKLAKDEANRLLSRGPRFRMDAEMVRDYALAASGLLVSKIGGPSVKPYQPDGVWEAVAMDVSNTRIYKRDSGENLYRRSLYTFWKRHAPPALMEIFNAPSRETCTVRRERTNTPLQALATLNDPQFVEAARKLAELAIKEAKEEEDRLDFMANRLLARSLKSKEEKIVESAFRDLLAHYKAETKEAEELISVGESKADSSLDKPTLAAYTMVANQLMNMDEVLNK